MSEKFLITGGQGFIGSWIAKRLVQEGVPAVLFDLSPDNNILSQVLEPDELGELERIFGDVSDAEKVRRVVDGEGVTHIVHLAGIQVPGCRRDPVHGARVNVLGTLAVFEAARTVLDQVKMIVYASSAAVAGKIEDYGGRISDDARHVPMTHYGVFKAANEGNARVYFADAGISSVGLRPYTVYGVGREIGVTSAPTKAIKAAVLGRAYTIPFSGPTSFVYVEDLAEIFIRAARSGHEGAVALNIRGQVETVSEFLARLCEVLPEAGRRITCEGDPVPIAFDFDESGLEALLGSDVPRTAIREGIQRTVDHFERLARSRRLHDRDLV